MSTPPGISEYRRREQSITLSPLEQQVEQDGAAQTTQELLTLNFGPTTRPRMASCACS